MFFAFGAVINVPWLGLGTVYLLAGRRAGDITTRTLLVFSGFALGVVFTAPLHGTIFRVNGRSHCREPRGASEEVVRSPSETSATR